MSGLLETVVINSQGGEMFFLTESCFPYYQYPWLLMKVDELRDFWWRNPYYILRHLISLKNCMSNQNIKECHSLEKYRSEVLKAFGLTRWNFFVVEILYFTMLKVPRSNILEHHNVSEKKPLSQLWVSVLTILVRVKQFMVYMKVFLQPVFRCWMALLVSAHQVSCRLYKHQAAEFQNTTQNCRILPIALIIMTMPNWSRSQKAISWKGNMYLRWEFSRI